MSLAIWVAIGLLAVSVLLGLLRVMTAPDSATLASILGILATIALARIMTRGRR